MRCPALLLLAVAALPGGQARYARLGDFEGPVEVQLQAFNEWIPATRNLPLPELAWVRTGAGARLEIELDDGCVLRIGPESLAELSDYTRLSTGQRVTLLSLDRGLAYLTGAPEGRDALVIAAPGAQATIRRGSRVRLEVNPQWSQVALIEGAIRFSSPAAELDLREGQTIRVEPAQTAKFYLYGEIPPLDQDRWSEDRDKALASSNSAQHLPGLKYGLNDLDHNGTWIDSKEYGTVWKPAAADGWAPFRNGKWLWYDTLGYTWISADTWGWLPYHYGRWVQQEGTGWLWVPGKDSIFSPGDVYWLRGTDFAAWGPLAPGEAWKRGAVPQLYLAANTTFAKFAPEAREIDPAQPVSKPREPLARAAFVAALPSPSFPAARLKAARPALRAGSTRVVPAVPGVAYEQVEETAASEPAAARPEPAPGPVQVGYPPAEQPPVVIVETPPPVVAPPPEIYYPPPVYTGIVVVNPPERRTPHREHRDPKPAPLPPPPPKSVPVPVPAAPPQPAPAPVVRRNDATERRVDRNPEPAKVEKPADKQADAPIPRKTDEARQPDRGGRRQ